MAGLIATAVLAVSANVVSPAVQMNARPLVIAAAQIAQ
jgi:hypothetical protein